jgi:hypothetical protein
MPSTSSSVSVLALLAALLGCGPPAGGDDPPTLATVEPALAAAGQELAVELRGERFHLVALQRHGGAPELDARFRAWIGDRELEELTWVDAGTLRGRLPAGLPVGVHGLRLVRPDGAEARLEGAFEVRAAAQVRLHATVQAPGAAAVGEEFEVLLLVLNGGGAPIAVEPSLQVGGAVPVETLAAPAPAVLPGGGGAPFRWRLRAGAPGRVELVARAGGTDPLTGANASVTEHAQVVIEAPPADGPPGGAGNPPGDPRDDDDDDDDDHRWGDH